MDEETTKRLTALILNPDDQLTARAQEIAVERGRKLDTKSIQLFHESEFAWGMFQTMCLFDAAQERIAR